MDLSREEVVDFMVQVALYSGHQELWVLSKELFSSLKIQQAQQDENDTADAHDDAVLPDDLPPDDLIQISGGPEGIQENIPFGFIQFISQDLQEKTQDDHDHGGRIAVPDNGGNAEAKSRYKKHQHH